MNLLITGGAGFIGSVTVKQLIELGHNVVVYDSLVKGHRQAVNSNFVQGCLSNKELLDETFKKFDIEGVLHFAGFIETSESMRKPGKFFENNVVYGLNLLDVMIKNNVKKIVFSSSAAIYGSKEAPLVEGDVKNPGSVYGETKLMFEKILKWYDKIYGLKHISLRYFNAAGAAYGLGEDHNPETHLIPLVLLTALGKREHIKIYGTDHATLDGTCIRDYIHVIDLARAHVLTINSLKEKSNAYNLGVGKGYSVKQVLEAAREITGRNIKVVEAGRRAGDAAILVANSDKIKKELGWKPKYSLKDIIESAWQWHKNNPNGFE